MRLNYRFKKPIAACTTLVAGVLLAGSLSSPLTSARPVAQKSAKIAAIPVEVASLRQAIIGQESGANFQAVNPHSGALGYGQVMPENIPSWSKEALGYSVSKKQFLSSPELQLKIIEHKLNQYWQRALVEGGGTQEIAVRRVAAHWYSGNPSLYTSSRPQFYNGHRYPSIAHYSHQVLAKYYQAKPVVLAAQRSRVQQQSPLSFQKLAFNLQQPRFSFTKASEVWNQK